MKNNKQEPTPLEWCEYPDIDVESQWVKDESENVYPQTLVNINGALFTLTQAKHLRDQLTTELREVDQ